jgi:hypothetical protein
MRNVLRPMAAALLVIALVPVSSLALEVGCADGRREGFTDLSKYPEIAGCGGGWTIPGISPFAPSYAPACPALAPDDTSAPACGRRAGDDSRNPEGEGCNAADLCAAGWHVCFDAEEVAALAKDGCAGATGTSDLPLLFLTRQSSTGCGQCASGTGEGPQCNSATCAAGCVQTENTSNDVFGCGNYGEKPQSSCGVLDRFSENNCSKIAEQGWSCETPNGFCESFSVVHSDPDTGGVLCCRGSFDDRNGDGVLDSAR